MRAVVILERSPEEGELREMLKRGWKSCFRCFLEREKMSIGMEILYRSRRVATWDEHDGSEYETFLFRAILSRVSEEVYC